MASKRKKKEINNEHRQQCGDCGGWVGGGGRGYTGINGDGKK